MGGCHTPPHPPNVRPCKHATRKRSLLLYLAGPDVEKIFETIPDNGDEKDYDVAAKKLTEHFAPKKNITYEIHVFRKAQQRHGETIDQFYTRLCQLAKTCEFANEKHEIKIQLIERCSSTRVRRKALREEAITLDDLLKYGRSLEVSEQQAGELEKTHEHSDSINALHKNTNRSRTRNPPYNKSKAEQMCFYCGGSYPHPGGKTSCPAFGKECRGCGRLGHFKEVCRAKHSGRPGSLSSKRRNIIKQINRMSIAKQPLREQGGAQSTSSASSDSETDNEYAFVVEPHSNIVSHHTVMKTGTSRFSPANPSPQARLKIHGTTVTFLTDSGATINILDPRDFQAMSQRYEIPLTPTRTKVKAFGSDHPVELSGKFEAVVESKKRMTVATLYVTVQENGSLLSCNTSVELGLIQFPNMQSDCSKKKYATPKSSKVSRTKTMQKSPIPVIAEVKGESGCKYEQVFRATYPAVFKGIGKLYGHEQKLHIDKSVPPVSQTYRRTPFHLRKQLDTWLDTYQADNIIEPVTDEQTRRGSRIFERGWLRKIFEKSAANKL